MKKILSCLILLIAGMILQAQTPTSFKYQAVVRDSQGELLTNQSISFRISLLQGSTTGTLLYSETHSTSSNGHGLVNLEIGNGKVTSGNMATVSWDSGPFYIKIEMDPDGGSNYSTMGTSKLLSVPFALHAATVPDIYLDNTDNQTLSLDNTQLSISNGNTVNLAQGSTPWNTDGSDISYLSGNVGIGVNKPKSRLEVMGDVDFTVNDTLFLVKDKEGNPVFAVFEDGVEIYVDDEAKGNVGGFAISGRSTAKSAFYDIMKVTPDSTRIYVSDLYKKGNVGGFAVSGRSTLKNTSTKFLNLSPENYFIGQESGKNISTGAYNSFLGYQSGYSTTDGSRNVFLGYKSGYANVSGDDNVFIGNNAGFNNVNGFANIFLGNTSGFENQNGIYNIFLGRKTGYYNTTGSSNIIIGDWAGVQNTTGNSNVFMGDYCGYSNTKGKDNIFVGANAGWSNDTGNYNVFIGKNSGYYNIGGKSNVFIGENSGQKNISGNFNVNLGTLAGYSNTEGNLNSFVGQESGKYNTTGSFNAFLGTLSGYSNEKGLSNVFLGKSAGYANSTGSYNVSIGTLSGEENNGNQNVFFGQQSGQFVQGGSYNVYLGPFTGSYNTNGDYNIFVGYGAGYNETGSNRLYIENSIASSTSALIYGEFDNNLLTFNANVGIGTKYPGIYELYIYGDAYASGGFYIPAAKASKSEYTTIDNPVAKVQSLNGIFFSPQESESKQKSAGLIAEEIEQILPGAVKTNENGEKAVDYSQLTPVLIEAIKTQQEQIDALKAEIETLKQGLK